MNGVTIKQEITEREVDKTTLVVVLTGVALTIALAVATTIKHAMAGNIGLVFTSSMIKFMCRYLMRGTAFRPKIFPMFLTAFIK